MTTFRRFVGAGVGTVMVGLATQAGALPPPPPGPQAPRVQAPQPLDATATRVASFFKDVARKSRDEARAEVDGFRAMAARGADARRKSAADFQDGCPSATAQALYDDLARAQAAIEARRAEIRRANEAARNAYLACNFAMGQPPTGMGQGNPCWVAYTGSFGGWSDLETQADEAIAALGAGRAALRALKCPACASSGAFVNYPLVTVGTERTGFTVPGQPTAPTRAAVRPGEVSVTTRVPFGDAKVCTRWDPGSVSVSVSQREGELDESARARLPHCAREETVGQLCEAVTVSALLPKLRELRLVPADVRIDPGNVELRIPRRTVSIPSGLRRAACQAEPTICTRVAGSATIGFDSADPLGGLTRAASASCVERRPLSGLCAAPPFGIEVTFQSIELPDPEHAELIVRGPDARVAKRRIVVDLTRPELRASCTTFASAPATLPPLPKVDVKVASLWVPQLCRQPELRALVARQ